MNEIKSSYLEKKLDEALRINERELAKEIKTIGFNCKRCAHCCKEEYGDNTVAVFPSEIQRICKKYGPKQDDIAIPVGNVRAFGWVLRKNKDCIFLKDGLCRIYDCRPHICRTYPFYLLDGILMVSECDGIGKAITDKESNRIAAALKRRYIEELRELTALILNKKPHSPTHPVVHNPSSI